MEPSNKKNNNNRLVVEEVLKKNVCENSAVYLNSKKVEELKFFKKAQKIIYLQVIFTGNLKNFIYENP